MDKTRLKCSAGWAVLICFCRSEPTRLLLGRQWEDRAERVCVARGNEKRSIPTFCTKDGVDTIFYSHRKLRYFHLRSEIRFAVLCADIFLKKEENVIVKDSCREYIKNIYKNTNKSETIYDGWVACSDTYGTREMNERCFIPELTGGRKKNIFVYNIIMNG